MELSSNLGYGMQWIGYCDPGTRTWRMHSNDFDLDLEDAAKDKLSPFFLRKRTHRN